MRLSLLNHFTFLPTAVICLSLLTTGCEWEKPAPLKQQAFDPAASITLHVAPKDLVLKIQKDLPASSLQIPVKSAQDGAILTDWKEYEGAIHIVRRWRERTRFEIHVAPDFNDPTGTSHVEVFDITEEKPSDPQPWYPNPDLRRPERSAEVLKMIGQLK
jgi:hypothetical protein